MKKIKGTRYAHVGKSYYQRLEELEKKILESGLRLDELEKKIINLKNSYTLNLTL